MNPLVICFGLFLISWYNNPGAKLKYLKGRGVFLNNRSMDDLFLNRMITPVEDAAGGEADKTRGKGSYRKNRKLSLKNQYFICVILKLF